MNKTTALMAALWLAAACSENERTRSEQGDDAAAGGGQGQGSAEGEGEGEALDGPESGDEGAEGEGEEVAGEEGESEGPGDQAGDEGDEGEEGEEGAAGEEGDGGEPGEGEGEDGGDEVVDEGEGEDGGDEVVDEGEGEGEPPGPGACDNAADRRLLVDQDVGGSLLQCTLRCVGEAAEGCVANCVALSTGLSPECAGCLQPAEECRNQNCLEMCIPDRSAVPCKDCWDRACGDAFLECSGLEEVPAPRDGPNLAAACLNDNDAGVIAQDPPPAFRRTAQACAGECFGEPEDCGPRCLSAGTGLTFSCATCFERASSCPFRRCFQPCLADPGAAPCQQCVVDECLPEFQICSGLDELPEDPEVPVLPAPEDACLDDADLAAIDAADMSGVSGQCAFECIGGPADCVIECIARVAAVTEDCADCFGRRQACQGDNCWAACLGGAAACVACMDQQCDPAFEACAGLEFPSPAEPEGGEGEGEGEDPGPEDACLADGDLVIANGPLNLWEQMGQCGLQCILQPPQCLKDCIVAETGLNGKCAECYGRAQTCKAEACFGECIGQAPDLPACAACMDNACWPAFESCAGYAFGDPPAD